MTANNATQGHWEEHIHHLSAADKKKWARDYCAIAELCNGALQRMGYDQQAADKVCHVLLTELTQYCGGRHIYFPKRERMDSSLRDDALYRDWAEQGLKPMILAEKYGISRTHVYRLINKKRTARQPIAH